MRILRGVLILAVGAVFAPGLIFPDSALSRAYLRQAAELYDHGDIPGALPLADTAIRLRGDYSDALYLKSLLLGSGRENRREALEAALAAVRGESWERYQPREGILRAAELLYRTRSCDEALELLGRLQVRDAAADYLVLRCLLGRGDRIGAEKELRSALASHPADPRFLREAFLIKDPLDPEVSALFLLMDRKDPAHLPAFSAFIRRIASPEEVPGLAEEYFARGGRDPGVSWALMEAQPQSRSGELPRFAALGGFLRMDLLRRASAVDEEGFRREFSRLLSGIDGVASLDEEGDGEEAFVLGKGRVLSWSRDRDRDRDGRDEFVLHFSGDGLPREWEARIGDAEVSCEYRVYPYVERLTVQRGGVRSRRFFGAGVFSAPVLRGLPAPEDALEIAAFPYQTDTSLLSRLEAESARRAFRIDETRGDEAEVRRFTLRDGNPVLLEVVRPDRMGERILRRVRYVQGVPVSGERDMDRDGRFETGEIYESGNLVAVELREEGFRETFFPAAFREWDLNRDGRVDAREYLSGRPGMRREYSSAFDGVFDAVAADPRPWGLEP